MTNCLGKPTVILLAPKMKLKSTRARPPGIQTDPGCSLTSAASAPRARLKKEATSAAPRTSAATPIFTGRLVGA